MKFLIAVLSLLISTQIYAQTSFPTLSIETIEGKTENLPETTKGKYTVIGMAFSQKAQKQLESWIQPVYDNFISKSGMAALVYDVNPRLVLMLTGAKKAVKQKAKKRLSKEVDDEFKNKIGIWEGSFSEIKSTLSIKSKDTFYIFVLDKAGNIIHKESGMHTEKKMDRIGELVEG